MPGTLLVTADYEIFGDGTGCITDCLLRPAETIASTCERYNSRSTFFVDVCEVWAFERAEALGWTIGSAQPASRIKRQLCEFVGRGHDVQLHLHPQWLDASWSDEKGWELQMDWWRLGLLGDSIGVERLTSLLRAGREWLENLLIPVDSEYKCRAFRAGAWSIQPEGNTLRALAAAGIVFDTTVAPGRFLDNGLSYFDFLVAPNHCWEGWAIDERVDVPVPDGRLWEAPIFTYRMPTLDLILDRMRWRPAGLPEGCVGAPAKPPRTSGRIGRTLATLSPHGRTRQLDFCSCTPREMARLIGAAEHYARRRQSDFPLVAIGHPKDFGEPNRLRRLFELTGQSSVLRLDSLSEPSYWRTTPPLLR